MAVLKTRIGLFRKKQDFAPQTTEEFLRILEDEVDRLSGMVDSLLKLTSLSIGDVGLAVGYANQMHFSRAFKNNYGISPREWRYQNHINNTVDSDEEHTQ